MGETTYGQGRLLTPTDMLNQFVKSGCNISRLCELPYLSPPSQYKHLQVFLLI